MTREEAIHFAECLKNNWSIDFNDMEPFCVMAINAINAVCSETGDDLISRRAALDEVYSICNTPCNSYFANAIKRLPSVKPPERCVAEIRIDPDELLERIEKKYGFLKRGEIDWIPTSERLPQVHETIYGSAESDYMLCCNKYGDIGILAFYKGEGWRDIEHMEWGDVIAWMPLPEPWEGEHDAELD